MPSDDPTREPDPLLSFSPPVRAWFAETFGRATPPQAQGWAAIQRGEHALILAPTGSGKTLAAFLWGIDQLYRELSGAAAAGAQPDDEGPGRTTTHHSPLTTHSLNATHHSPLTPPAPRRIRLVYISPLKALNNDIQRNLEAPLAGIVKAAERLGLPFPEIRAMVRSGDTPQRERQSMLKRPPDILITTPESLYLLLTGARAQQLFEGAHTVIVDEIHTLVGEKRGVHLALTLERLERAAGRPLQRIGLSATIRPLEEAARFLGGMQNAECRMQNGEGAEAPPHPEGLSAAEDASQPGHSAFCILHSPFRPVAVVDAHYRKAMDLQVVTPVEDFRHLAGGSVWPAIIRAVADLIRQHRSTLIFCNTRRMAEQTADRLNEQFAAEARGEETGLIKDGVTIGRGMMATGTGGSPNAIRAHHGSMSREARLQMEHDLKSGDLPALVATGSLELGIDIGAVDLVVQLQSPESVAKGLQRVGRSGHVVGETSKGIVFPTHREDVVAAAAIAAGMRAGDVEPTATPRQPLDVLAQQIVAMVAVETWEVDALYHFVRRAYPYRDLTPRLFHAVLEMLAGRYDSKVHRELRPRLSWDRVNNRLAALPGAKLLALSNGGTIPNRGAFSAFLGDRKTRLGELDEEFVFETKVGDVFMLGSQTWRVTEITDDRVLVTPAPGLIPRLPFWRGDTMWRPYALGKRLGEFRRHVADRLKELGLKREHLRTARAGHGPAAALRAVEWLREEHSLDDNSAWNLLDYVAGQIDAVGAAASDRAVVVEVFEDAVGDPRMVVHSPFGGRVNGPWGLALARALRERFRVSPEVQTSDDGILLRFPESDAEFPLDLVPNMTAAEARALILHELPDSPVFGARFRQNAARALLLPIGRPGRRTPFWLQRLRARDLLHALRRFDDFPIVIETYRDCLEDVMDLPHLEEVLRGIEQGSIQVVTVESLTPSPVAQSLLQQFASIHVYEWDAPKAERQLHELTLNRALLQDLLKDVDLGDFLKPEAITQVAERLQHAGPTARARTVEELAVAMEEMGDLSADEIAARSAIGPEDWIGRLAGENRLAPFPVPAAGGEETRWVAATALPEYQAAFAPQESPLSPGGRGAGGEGDAPAPRQRESARRAILRRFLEHSGPVTLTGIQARYALPEAWLLQELERLVAEGIVAHGRFTPEATADQYVLRANLEQIQRHTLTLLRREVQAVPRTVYADFLARWQHLHPATRLAGREGLTRVLQRLRAIPVVGRVWERDVLPLRLASYAPADLEEMCRGGEVVWVASGETDRRRARVRFLFRGEGNTYLGLQIADCRLQIAGVAGDSAPLSPQRGRGAGGEGLPADPSAPAPLSPQRGRGAGGEGLSLSLSEAALQTHDFFRSEGAVFVADVAEALELAPAAVEDAISELVLAGLATNDSLDALRRFLRGDAGGGRAPGEEKRAFSALESQLAERRRGPLTPGPSPTLRGEGRPARHDRSAYKAAKRRASERVQQSTPIRWLGRWSLVRRFAVMGKRVSDEERALRRARQLLQRWGVVTRAAFDAEWQGWEWEAILDQLRLMEMRGEVRRGYFVEGLPGMQFALPEVVEQLRALRDPRAEEEPPVVLNACDPANLYGPEEGSPVLTALGRPLAFARLPSTYLVQWRGAPVLLAEGLGSALTTVQGVDDALLSRALDALVAHLLRSERRVTVQTWNAAPVLESAGAALLEGLGFYRELSGMRRERGV